MIQVTNPNLALSLNAEGNNRPQLLDNKSVQGSAFISYGHVLPGLQSKFGYVEELGKSIDMCSK